MLIPTLFRNQHESFLVTLVLLSVKSPIESKEVVEWLLYVFENTEYFILTSFPFDLMTILLAAVKVEFDYRAKMINNSQLLCLAMLDKVT